MQLHHQCVNFNLLSRSQESKQLTYFWRLSNVAAQVLDRKFSLIKHVLISYFSAQENTDSAKVAKATRSTSHHDIQDDDDEYDKEQPYGFAYDVDDLPKIVMVHTLDRDPAKKERGSTVVDISPEGIFLPGVVLSAPAMTPSLKQSKAEKWTRHSTTACYLEPETEGNRTKFWKTETNINDFGKTCNEKRKAMCSYGSDFESDRTVSDLKMKNRPVASSLKQKKSIYIPDDKQIYENDTVKRMRFDEEKYSKRENIDREVPCQKRKESVRTYEMQKSKFPMRRDYQTEKDKRAMMDDSVYESQDTVYSKALIDKYAITDLAADQADQEYLRNDITSWKRKKYLAECDYDYEHINEMDMRSHKDQISHHFSSSHISNESAWFESRRKGQSHYNLGQLDGSVSKRHSSLSDDSYRSNSSSYWLHESDEDSSNSDSSSLEETALPVRYARRNIDIVYI
eukprot:Seg2119.5 transcript_id=Seg2119.5/GoldUCD/mRNA.D3Y31 product="hypothetical protein" protein_id=Seg2119.5/GoldUCD/D3Y31